MCVCGLLNGACFDYWSLIKISGTGLCGGRSKGIWGLCDPKLSE